MLFLTKTVVFPRHAYIVSDLIDPSPFILIPAAPETSAWEWSD